MTRRAAAAFAAVSDRPASDSVFQAAARLASRASTASRRPVRPWQKTRLDVVTAAVGAIARGVCPRSAASRVARSVVRAGGTATVAPTTAAMSRTCVASLSGNPAPPTTATSACATRRAGRTAPAAASRAATSATVIPASLRAASLRMARVDRAASRKAPTLLALPSVGARGQGSSTASVRTRTARPWLRPDEWGTPAVSTRSARRGSVSLHRLSALVRARVTPSVRTALSVSATNAPRGRPRAAATSASVRVLRPRAPRVEP
jgi:hypothetical protein